MPRFERQSKHSRPGALGDRRRRVLAPVVYNDYVESRIGRTNLGDDALNRDGLVEGRDDRHAPQLAVAHRRVSRAQLDEGLRHRPWSLATRAQC